jgi:hypothetical protein
VWSPYTPRPFLAKWSGILILRVFALIGNGSSSKGSMVYFKPSGLCTNRWRAAKYSFKLDIGFGRSNSLEALSNNCEYFVLF